MKYYNAEGCYKVDTLGVGTEGRMQYGAIMIDAEEKEHNIVSIEPSCNKTDIEIALADYAKEHELYPDKELDRALECISLESCDYEEAPQTTNLDFGQALQFLKAGKKVARAGWNGKGQWVCYMPSFVVEQPNERTKAHGINDAFKCGGYCVLWNAQSVWQPGWVPSQGDLFANDWQVVE